MTKSTKNVQKPDIQHPDFLQNVARNGFHRIIHRARRFSFNFLKAQFEASDSTTTIEPFENKHVGR